jgi:threonine dehydrogenase-like Zn-dependent dehydrogenase
MRAAHYLGDGVIDVRDVEERPAGSGEVTVAVAYTGICGTDLHVLHGAMDARVTTPAVLGHEMSGRVAEVGPAVTGWAAGDPVTVMPLRWCGTCPACRAGFTHVCQRLVFVGIDAPGSLRQRWNVPADLLVRLPREVSLRAAALVEPTAVAAHDVERADLRPGESALVVGAGPVGLLIATVARGSGARVLVSEPTGAAASSRATSGSTSSTRPPRTSPTGPRPGPAGPVRTSRSRCPGRSRGSTTRCRRSPSAAASSSSGSTRSHGRSTCSGSSGAS